MKKSFVSALTAALAVGTASVGFAAANPFADVPSGHWAYAAVAELAAEGIIDGYGDGTYRGEQQITRYEMAQMIARAMAKGENSAALDKLAAEFADELNSLGVRVANLEKKVDNVKFHGSLQYTFVNNHNKEEANINSLIFRLEPEATVNKHWTVYSRLDVGDEEGTNLKTSADINGADFKLDRLWAEGTYGSTVIKLGKLQYDSNFDGGMMWDDRVSGIQIVGGNKLKFAATAGRWRVDGEDDDENNYLSDSTANYQGIEIFNDPDSKWTYGIAFHHVKGGMKGKDEGNDLHVDLKREIGEIGIGYKFSDSLSFLGAYAGNFKKMKASFDGAPAESFGSSKDRTAYSLELDYKEAAPEERGSYGVWAAYRHLGIQAVLSPTYDGLEDDLKGWEIGASYVPLKNIVTTVIYAHGKSIMDDERSSKIWGRVEYFF